MAKIVEYVRPLGENTRKRHFHSQEGGRILHLAVQLELFYNGEWRPVIRYDTAHGFAHTDFHHASGEVEKEKLMLGFEKALTLADEDIDENWERHVKIFLGEGDT